MMYNFSQLPAELRKEVQGYFHCKADRIDGHEHYQKAKYNCRQCKHYVTYPTTSLNEGPLPEGKCHMTYASYVVVRRYCSQSLLHLMFTPLLFKFWRRGVQEGMIFCNMLCLFKWISHNKVGMSPEIVYHMHYDTTILVQCKFHTVDLLYEFIMAKIKDVKLDIFDIYEYSRDPNILYTIVMKDILKTIYIYYKICSKALRSNFAGIAATHDQLQDDLLKEFVPDGLKNATTYIDFSIHLLDLKLRSRSIFESI